jgi:uncharacterized membrane protein
MSLNQPRHLRVIAASSLIALTFLCLGWELWWAPLRPGGSLLALKSLPLLLPLFGILHGKRYTYQWSSMFILLYIMEGLVRTGSESGPGRMFALAETVLALVFFLSTVAFARLTGKRPGVTISTTAD